jgi:hypothetical protein
VPHPPFPPGPSLSPSEHCVCDTFLFSFFPLHRSPTTQNSYSLISSIATVGAAPNSLCLTSPKKPFGGAVSGGRPKEGRLHTLR